VQGLLEFAKTLGAPRIAAMAAVTLADKSDALGTTSFIQNINNLRAPRSASARSAD
jgi:hypothetical protein